MQKLTENQIIEKLKQMKQIKPRENWASLTLSKILSEENAETVVRANSIEFSSIVENIFSALFQRKLAYSFALFAFVIVGMLSFANSTVPGDALFPVKKIAEDSQASLSGKTVLSQNIAKLNNRVKDFERVSKEGKEDNIPATISEIRIEVLAVAVSLKEDGLEGGDAKEIADTLKVLASVQGTDLSEDAEVKDLYKLVVENQIEDLENSTLTEEQSEIFEGVKELYGEEKYAEALEVVLTIGQQEEQEN